MPPMNLTQIEQARAEYTPPASADPHYDPAEVRAEVQSRLIEIQSEFERPVPGRHAVPRRPYQNTWGAPLTEDQRAAAERTTRAKSQLIRHTSVVAAHEVSGSPGTITDARLPIDDAIKIPTPPPPPTPRRPAATYQTVIPDQAARPLPSGMLRRELRLPRPGESRYEHLAQGCYTTLDHEARLLLRILDTARDTIAEYKPLDPINYLAIPFGDLLACFRRDGEPGYEGWEHNGTLWKAIDDLVQAQILCIVPGATQGVQALFVAEHALRTMLGHRVLTEPHVITLVRLREDVVNAAQASLRSRNVA